MTEQVKRTDASEEHRAACQKKLDVLLEQHEDLSTAIDQLLDDLEAGRKWMKVYKQTSHFLAIGNRHKRWPSKVAMAMLTESDSTEDVATLSRARLR